jgi:hypothetical protein
MGVVPTKTASHVVQNPTTYNSTRKSRTSSAVVLASQIERPMQTMPSAAQSRISARRAPHQEDAWRNTILELQARTHTEGKEDSDDGDAMRDELSLSELAFWMDYDDLGPMQATEGQFIHRW